MNNIHGYTTMMCPEGMKLPYLEALASWSTICDTITICFSKFPEVNMKVPDGAVKPWADDHALEILKKFDSDVLGNKLRIVHHDWDINEPLSDGLTKQKARSAVQDSIGNSTDDWLIHFDADEILHENNAAQLASMILDDNKQPLGKKHPYISAGVLEFFGGLDKVRFGFGTWIKMRATRNMREVEHGLPLRFSEAPVRGKNKRTGKIISMCRIPQDLAHKIGVPQFVNLSEHASIIPEDANPNIMDDGAGFITNVTYNRPDLNIGLFGFNVQILNMIGQTHMLPYEQKPRAWVQVAQALQQDIDAGGLWIYHTAWADIARKWNMGWFWNNMWCLLTGQQDTFAPADGTHGKFTPNRAPIGDELPKELAKETARLEIQSIKIAKPQVFQEVNDWRSKNNL